MTDPLKKLPSLPPELLTITPVRPLYQFTPPSSDEMARRAIIMSQQITIMPIAPPLSNRVSEPADLPPAIWVPVVLVSSTFFVGVNIWDCSLAKRYKIAISVAGGTALTTLTWVNPKIGGVALFILFVVTLWRKGDSRPNNFEFRNFQFDQMYRDRFVIPPPPPLNFARLPYQDMFALRVNNLNQQILLNPLPPLWFPFSIRAAES